MKLIQSIKNSSAFQNIARISAGTLAGQVISVMTIPIFTRMYGAAIIGEHSFLYSLVMTSESFSDLGLCYALMTEKEDTDLMETYKTISTFLLGVCILGGAAAFLYFGFISPESVQLPLWFTVFFLVVSAFVLQQIRLCSTWLNREQKYHILMKNPVLNNICFGVVGLALGLLGFREYGYFVGWLTGKIITMIHLRRCIPRGQFTLKPSSFRRVISRNRRFVAYQLPTTIASSLKGQLPVLLIKQLFGSDVLGQYAITWKVINIPVNLLGSAIGRVFFSRSSELQRSGKPLGDFAFRNMMLAMKVALLPICCIMAFGDVALNLILGPGWQMAGDIIRIVSLYAFFWFLTLSMEGLTITLNKQHYAMTSALAQMVTITTSMTVGAYVFGSVYVSMFLHTVTFTAVNIVYFVMLFRAMQAPWKKYLRNVLLCIFFVLGGYLILRFGLLALGLVSSL